jgi:hypothetical protein
MIRKYEKDVRKAAAIIAYEVIMTGESSGWVSSDFDFFKKLKEMGIRNIRLIIEI